MAIKKIGTLDIEETALTGSRIFYRVQSICYVFLLLILLAAFLGLTGSGFLQQTQVSNDKFAVQYDRFARQVADTQLSIKLNSSQNNATVWVSQEYLNNFYIKQIIPKPLFTEVDPEKIIFHFQTHPGVVPINFLMESESVGFANGSIGFNNTILNFRQFFYP